MSYNKAGNKNIYYPVPFKKEYIRKWTRAILNDAFVGSIHNFMVALADDKNLLSEEEEKDLRKFLGE